MDPFRYEEMPPEVDLSDLEPGQSRVIQCQDREVAVFNVQGRLYAIANRCPHRGAPLSRGQLEGAAVRCPLHGWLFDLESGRCLNQEETCTTAYQLDCGAAKLVLEEKPAS